MKFRTALSYTAPLLITITLILAACSSGEKSAANEREDSDGKDPRSPAAAVEIKSAGSTFAAPIIESWIDSYTDVDSEIALHYDAVGSGEGIRRYLESGVDIGASDALLNPEELKLAEGTRQLPLTAGMIGITYNMPQLTQPLRLSREAYTGIFLGTVDRWDDPLIVAENPQANLPAKLIQLVARADSSGTTHSFTEHLSTISPQWAAGPGTSKRYPFTA
ncbi:phosphate ABC transporter substrate-binding protein PstS [Granulosicoccus sp. 3-233]|uniref:phosphate ABC transporter substrate-binding protein PstS n=1 Tax=Granulosicoccus sp. 3-233 TaxID=3417969 RepID=UPI003D33A3ED